MCMRREKIVKENITSAMLLLQALQPFGIERAEGVSVCKKLTISQMLPMALHKPFRVRSAFKWATGKKNSNKYKLHFPLSHNLFPA